ncbi:MAG: metallophosphoesterase family protein [Elusimicrobia bacterium]|nr:metallophosphoesterase family protein [Elusimicrobiota bacterium]
METAPSVEELAVRREPRNGSWLAAVRNELRLGHYLPLEVASVAAFAGGAFGVLALAAFLIVGEPPSWAGPGVQRLVLGLAGAGLACIAWGALVEPWRLRVRELRLRSPKVRGRPLRLAHLSDLHVRTWGAYEQRVLDTVRGLAPDAVLLTGDYSAGPGRLADAERLLRELAALAPCFAVRGNCEFMRPLPPAPAGPRWLPNRAAKLDLAGTPVTVFGAEPGDDGAVRALGEPADPERLAVLLYHYPDFVPQLAQLPYDLMLCGHTHGGQIRLPWIGALASLSRAGTRYAAGLFQRDGKSAYVTHGIGTESCGLPAVRFLCPPEIALFVIGPD